MNAAAAARASIIRTSMVPIPAGFAYSNDVESTRPPAQGMQGRDAGPRMRAAENPSDQVSHEERQRVIQVLDYLEYKARCDYERQQQQQQQQQQRPEQKSGFYTAGPNDSFDSLNKPPPDVVVEVDSSSRGRVVRMFTIFPYRDMSWVVNFGFVTGSIVFVVNAVLGVLPVIDPALAFPTLTTVALPATILIGAFFFLVSGCLGFVAAFNANRGTVEVPIKGAMSGGANYRPALIGSESWVWFPSGPEFAKIAQTFPFQAGVFQLTGGMILSISAFAGIPGLLNPEENLALFQGLVFLPQVIGGSMFVFANIVLTIFVQDRWYKPKPSCADWQGGFWNAVGSTGFAITGVLLLMGDTTGAAWTSLYGSVAFLMGSVIQLYALMEFHPTPWAA
ncbi:hypothetical protein MCOR27_005486 [Pyricularia oryzae]|nr:hypothetical protein MCOR01_009146 [Pyricularia oryzae]KAH9439842.1 hypothetical protein MCOR02_003374 [Pyricularia oryzae]KAI6278765.1 hypothetical protein MCOR27_005486 [Pyricularia oryzae]KAI6312135.1 hypothetical protein MCOR30_010648 [Pyricularia oryzae]KAI6315408.1 hypothetical protein MCOR29_006964 [Pyricularia oryzae]